MTEKQSFTITHDGMEVLALSSTPEELTARRTRLEARLQEMDQEISLSATPTTEQVEQYQREHNVEDFGTALREIISEQDLKRHAFAQPEAGMSETDRENELKRLVDERMDADRENYIND